MHRGGALDAPAPSRVERAGRPGLRLGPWSSGYSARSSWSLTTGGRSSCRHVGSALVVYTAIGLWRLLDPAALRAAWSAADYGVSAVSAAWLGVIAATGWRARESTWPGRAAIALSCMALSILAYMLRPGISLFASEHVIAFATGAAIAYRYAVRQPVKAIDARSVAAFLTTLQRGARRARWLGRVDPVALAASVVAVSLLVGSTMPSALAALSRSLLDRESPSRCSAPGRGHASLLSCEDRRQLNVRFP